MITLNFPQGEYRYIYEPIKAIASGFQLTAACRGRVKLCCDEYTNECVRVLNVIRTTGDQNAKEADNFKATIYTPAYNNMQTYIAELPTSETGSFSTTEMNNIKYTFKEIAGTSEPVLTEPFYSEGLHVKLMTFAKRFGIDTQKLNYHAMECRYLFNKYTSDYSKPFSTPYQYGFIQVDCGNVTTYHLVQSEIRGARKYFEAYLNDLLDTLWNDSRKVVSTNFLVNGLTTMTVWCGNYRYEIYRGFRNIIGSADTVQKGPCNTLLSKTKVIMQETIGYFCNKEQIMYYNGKLLTELQAPVLKNKLLLAGSHILNKSLGSYYNFTKLVAGKKYIFLTFVNSLGGIDALQMEETYRQSVEQASINTQKYYDANNNVVEQVNDIQTTSTITLSTGIVSRDVLEALSDLVMSPYIRLHISLSTYPVVLEKCSIDICSTEPTGEWIGTFRLLNI